MPGFEDHSHQLGSNPLKNEGPTKKSNRICTSRQTVCPEIRNGGAGGFMKPPGPTPQKSRNVLLYFNGCAGVGELLFDGLSFVLADAFFDGLGCAVNQVLGFFQAEA